MVMLGVGKNMVRAIRFWVQAMGVAQSDGSKGLRPSAFGHAVFSPKGFDPFMEDVRTLWLLHWNLSTHVEDPLFAWDFLLNRWPHPEFSRSKALRAFHEESKRDDRQLSDVTLEQHFDVFLHTYIPTGGRKDSIREENLDCPLIEIKLIEPVGERSVEGTGRREPMYGFRRGPKTDITGELFAFCLQSYWTARHAAERTLSLRDVSLGHGSPGQVFKLNEFDVRERLESIEQSSGGAFAFRESAALSQIVRSERHVDFLAQVFAGDALHG
jgi:hypothetical protein